MANAFWWAWRREHTKSCSCLIVYDRSSITTPPLLLYLLNSAMQILIIFWTYQVISCSSLSLNFLIHIHPHFGKRNGKTKPSFKSQFMYHFLPQGNLTSLSIAPPSKVPEIILTDWLSLLCAPKVSFLLTDQFNLCSQFLLEEIMTGAHSILNALWQ